MFIPASPQAVNTINKRDVIVPQRNEFDKHAIHPLNAIYYRGGWHRERPLDTAPVALNESVRVRDQSTKRFNPYEFAGASVDAVRDQL
jgi:hypothetical protein